MRSYLLASMFGLATFAAPPASHAQHGTSLRTAQVLAMGSDKPERLETGEGRAFPLQGPTTSPLFQIHDLSQRWVEFQMRGEFSPDGLSANADSRTAPDIGAEEGGSMGVDPYSTIAVPSWMRAQPYAFASLPPENPVCQAARYSPSRLLRPAEEMRRQSYFGLMSQIACAYGIPVGLFDAMIIQESRYDASIYSPKQAYGLTQLMPATALSLGVNRYDVEGNLRGGATYLRQQLDRFGHYHLALAAYNAGPGRVKNGRIPQISETQSYVASILSNWTRLTGLYRQTTVITDAAPVPAAGRIPSVSRF